jgi:hypothetical protein
MNDDLEWKIEKPIIVEGKENKFTVQCGECKDFFLVPVRPFCDVCRHGIACIRCSPKLILKWIQEGNLKKGDLPAEQLDVVQKLIREKFSKEIYVDQEDFLRVK